MTDHATDEVTAVPSGTLRKPGWSPEAVDISPRRARKHAMAATVRDLIRDLSQLDVETVDDTTLEGLETALDTAAALLQSAPDIRGEDGSTASSRSGPDGALFERSPFTGRSNALAAPLVLSFDGTTTLGHATYHDAYEGPRGQVHGGAVIAAFDDLLGVAQAASGTAGFTGTLSVRLVKLTPLNQRIDYEAGVDRVEGRKIIAWGKAYHDGELLAEAEGIFVRPATRPAR